MDWSAPRINAEERDAESASCETDMNRFELRCGMCGGVHYADERTFERVNTAKRAGLDNPFKCDACDVSAMIP